MTKMCAGSNYVTKDIQENIYTTLDFKPNRDLLTMTKTAPIIL